ncbi:MAG: glycoside hydrolase family 32 protein [Brooklawnia sp.]|uniref:glycoside hydrolase family 32 protein n=1 Tax=Brooklawnia sp. TaxID=2699740 RepID=UPI003C777A70
MTVDAGQPVQADPGRPLLHFTPRAGWINDPYALTCHDGQYHLFYQAVPGQLSWHLAQHWGHATSPDLLSWTEQPVVLSPGDGDDGIWSGSIAVPRDGPAAIFYTSARRPHLDVAASRIARPLDDQWTRWQKGPVVASAEPGLGLTTYRDPYVFHDGSTWRMLMGAGFADGRAAALGYSSDDLTEWRYDGVLTDRHSSETDPIWVGQAWECPQLFPLGDRWVLVVSVWDRSGPHYVAYAVGDCHDRRFIPQHWHRLSYGPSHYAASTFLDRDGRRGLIHWLRGVADPAGGWAGAHSLPHVLELVTDRIVAAPHPNLTTMRGAPAETLHRGATTVPQAADLEWSLDSPDASAGLALSAGGRDRALQLTARQGLLAAATPAGVWQMPLLPDGPPLRIVIDGPVVEVFSAAGVLAVSVASRGDQRTLQVQGDASVRWYPLNRPGRTL